MKRWIKKASIALMVTLLLVSALLIRSDWGKQASGKKEKSPYENFIVVDLFDSLANYQGIQSGWFAKIVKDKFNMELNIIAPNVAGGGKTLYEIRAAAGYLGDLVIYGGDTGVLQDMVNSGLILDMSGMIQDRQIMRFSTAIYNLNDQITPEGIYAIPSEVSMNSPLTPSESLEPTFGPYLRWDLYQKLGYPQLSTLEDLLPVLKDMQELEPVAENGQKTYAFSFFRDWDDNLMNAAKQPCCFYGYDEFGFVLAKADGSDYQSITDSDSLYVRVLKLYFDANQMGLVDPESVTQNYETFVRKYREGQLLYSPWPWVSQPVYNTTARKEAGKGFMLADIKDMEIYSYGCSVNGNHRVVMAIGSRTEDPQRIADFIDWLYSPEGIAINGAQSSAGTAGPQGLCWEYGENGPELTEFGKKAILGGDAAVPKEWGGGSWSDGLSELNYKAVSTCEVDESGYPYAYQLWDSVLAMEESPLDLDWREKMKADSTRDFLLKNKKILVAPGCGYLAPAETAEESAIREQCRGAVQKYSWEMVFAEDETEFYRLLGQMQKELASLNYERILETDLKNAKEKNQARINAVAEYEAAQVQKKK